MPLLKCIKQDEPGQDTSVSSNKSSPGGQYPLVKLQHPQIIRGGDTGDVQNHGLWYQFDDADTSGVRCVTGYAVAWDSSEEVSNISEIEENIASIMFVSSCGQYLQTTMNHGDRDQNNHVTLCRASEEDLDTLIFILTQMRENL